MQSLNTLRKQKLKHLITDRRASSQEPKLTAV